MPQAKINKQKYFLFNFPHRTLFLNYPQYATPLELPTPCHLSYPFIPLHPFLAIHTALPHISAAYKG